MMCQYFTSSYVYAPFLAKSCHTCDQDRNWSSHIATLVPRFLWDKSKLSIDLLPLIPGRLCKVHFQPIHDKIKGCLSGLEPSLFVCVRSWGGGIMMNKVVSAIPTYVITVMKQPKQSLQEIDKTRQCFLWVGNEDMHGGKCKVNWLKVCSLVHYDGLGFSNLEKIGRALWLRWLWYEWRAPNKPLIKTETSCDELDNDMVAASTKVLIGDGRKACFCKSNWIGGQILKSQAPNLYRHSKRKNRRVQEAMQQGRWISDICHSLTIALLTEFFHIWGVLAQVPPQLTDGVQDSIVWRWTTNGEYSAKSSYQFQFNGMVISPSTKLT